MLRLIIIFVATMLALFVQWAHRKFGDITYEQILFHLNISLDSETRLLKSFLQNTVMLAAILIIVLYVVFGLSAYRWPVWGCLAAKVRANSGKIVALYMAIVLAFVAYRIDLREIVQDYWVRDVVSTFYEENWADARQVEITFPKQKRNLVLIFGESFEASFVSDKNRPFFKDNFMPEIRKLAQENVNFSEDADIGGMIPLNNTQWTQAGLVSQTCGIPLNLPIVNHNKFLPKHGYLSQASCLFDLLNEQGYRQIFMTGMEGNYAGVDCFFETHGQVEVIGWEHFQKKYNLNGEADAFRSEIVRDKTFLEEAKLQLRDLAKQGKPFALTLMTMDTHCGNEYFDEKNCPASYAEGYKNVYACSSRQVADFIKWIKQQGFYKETTVVLVGDHLVMNDDIFENAEQAERRVLNIFINSARSAGITHPRRFSPFDIYPSIVEAIGGRIKGDKLGLGVSLFSKTPTLLERGYTPESLEDEMSKRSRIYEHLLYGKDLK